MTAAALVLIVLGGLAQLCGVGLVASEVRATRLRLNEYVSRPQVVEVGAALETEVALPIRRVVDPPPPVEERLRQLEDHVWALREQVARLPTELAPGLRNEIQETQERVARAARRETEALGRTVLALNDARALALRKLSIGLIVGGVSLATLGSALTII